MSLVFLSTFFPNNFKTDVKSASLEEAYFSILFKKSLTSKKSMAFVAAQQKATKLYLYTLEEKKKASTS